MDINEVKTEVDNIISLYQGGMLTVRECVMHMVGMACQLPLEPKPGEIDPNTGLKYVDPIVEKLRRAVGHKKAPQFGQRPKRQVVDHVVMHRLDDEGGE